MDRRLSIALLAGLLALLGTYGLRQVLRIGVTSFKYQEIRRDTNPTDFWIAVILVSLIILGVAALSAVSLVDWLFDRPLAFE